MYKRQGPSKFTKVVKKYGPISITGPPSFLYHDSGFGWKDSTPGNAKIALPSLISPIKSESINSLAFWIPPPKNVSGAFPR